MQDTAPIRLRGFARHSPLWRHRRACAIAAGVLCVVGIVAACMSSAPSSSSSSSFFMIQLTDPQFGLEHANVHWDEEEAMLNLSIRII